MGATTCSSSYGMTTKGPRIDFKMSSNRSYAQIDLDALERLPRDLFASMAPEDKALVLAAVDELRAIRKVVAAYRAVDDLDATLAPVDAALAELDALNGHRD